MISKAQFLERFLHQGCEGESYWVTTPISPENLEKAVAAATDEIGFENHKIHFDLLANIIDEIVAEYVEATKRSDFISDNMPNTMTHLRIKALVNLPAEQRAGIIYAAAQSMRWIDQIHRYAKELILQNKIGMRVCVGVLRCFSKKKQCFSAEDLKAIVRLGGLIRGHDSFGVIAQMAIVETLATNIAALPIDRETKTTLPKLLNYVAARSDLAYVVNAIRKSRLKLKSS